MSIFPNLNGKMFSCQTLPTFKQAQERAIRILKNLTVGGTRPTGGITHLC
ncbi:MAG: hypothetical protein FWF09_07425 [Bacteroidales bacterium]|nr:hypothetical protein [Bacteroidales bacterium]